MKINYPLIRRITVSVVLILLVLAFTGNIVHYINKRSRQDCWTDLKTATQDINLKVDNYLKEVMNSASGQVNMVSNEPDLKAPYIHQRITNTIQNSLHTTLRLYLPDGYAILEDGSHKDVSAIVNYEDIFSQSLYLSEPKEDPFNKGKYIIEIFNPVRNGDNIRGMFAAVIHIENIPSLISTSAYDGNYDYLIVNHKDGTVLVDTIKNTNWNVNDFSEIELFAQMLKGIEDMSTFTDENNQENYAYTLPCQLIDCNIAIIASEEVVMKKDSKLRHLLWYAFFIEAICFLIYLIWICIDTHFQVKIAAKAAQKEELEKQQIALENALNMAKSANRAKTVFLNNMSHDIRTPMNAIIGYTELAKNNINDKEKVQDYLSKIGQSSDHLLSLINDILDMSRIESGKMNLEFKYESLTHIVNTLESIIQADLTAKNLEFSLEIKNIVDDTISCDKLRLNQVLLNILSNAIKYTQPGGKISLSIEQKPKTDEAAETTPYEIRIKDNGIGMSKDFLKNIYEPFTRVTSSTVSGIQGTGLGMSIAKNLVERMNGTIQIISKEQIGTEVVLHFNFKTSSKAKHLKQEVEPVKEYDFTGKKILLVEDNEMNLEIAEELLHEMGCITFTANDGSVALEMIKAAKKGDYDIVLMDVQMPILNGYETTKKIRALEFSDYNDIPIIAMTANAFVEDRKEALKCGMNEHIPKPLSIPQLKDVMSRFLSQ